MSHRLLISAFWLLPYACGLLAAGAHPNESSIPPTVVQVDLREMVEPVSAEFVVRGIRHANQVNAQAVLIEIDTPGGLETSMREIIQAIIESRVPVITYVAPLGATYVITGTRDSMII